ncbi:helix-turn-helix domain-containing protein [Amycolatopsis anabasis]|uniref:helix-turn-helix domain-containing protein n=1 Tax=Amycolatopsis anabasis TaxID=1840409 RepID=UPI00131B1834|nr:helix-turn-helix transcriptional regulator [Amycolatopsis anabasis]
MTGSDRDDDVESPSNSFPSELARRLRYLDRRRRADSLGQGLTESEVKRRYNQSAVARSVGISAAYASKLFNGTATKGIKRQLLDKLAEFYEVSTAFFDTTDHRPLDEIVVAAEFVYQERAGGGTIVALRGGSHSDDVQELAAELSAVDPEQLRELTALVRDLNRRRSTQSGAAEVKFRAPASDDQA